MTTGLARPVVLLVEDETLVAMAAEDSLQALGFETICAETGAAALIALAKNPKLAFAIIDVGLPDVRGDDLAARIRSEAPGLPIVMASGYDGQAISMRFGEDPAITIMGKPYSEYDLKKVIAALGLAAG